LANADIDHNASANEIIVRITCLVGEAGRRDRASTLLLAELLEVPTEDQLPPAAMTPNQRRDETLAILEDLVLRARNGPVLLVLEDAHWSDLTTQTLVERLLKRVDRERALVLLTYRPELKTDWRKHPNATFIACKQIGHEQCAALIQNVASGMQMDPVLIEEIIARSDGVPLFVEELTKAVLDLHTPDAGAVPLTLRDSLMARLDRLGPPKEIAQIASVLGRQFTFEALKAVAATNDSDLHAALAKLREAGLVYELERNCDDGLSFNHSLVQEAAYDSLPRGRRRILHSQVARYLEAQSAAAGDPTLIAYHFGRAAEPAKSVHYWLEAADQASRRVALAESAANLGAALDEAERISDPQLRKRLMLDAQLKLSATIAIHKGPHSDEAQSSLEKAEALARETGEGAKLFQAVWGLYLNAARNRRYSKAKQRGDELLRISRDLNDRDLQYEALHHQWGYAYFIGRTADILSLTAEGVRNYNRARHHRFSYVYAGHDPGVCAHCVRALGLGLAGHGREVRPTLNTGLALANDLEHPLTLAFFHSVACFAMYLADDADGCQEFAEELIKVSTKYDLAATRAVGSFVTGASLGLRGDVTAALKQMEPSFEPTLTYGFMGVLPGVIMIEMLNRVGRSQEALALAIRLLDDLPDPEAAVFVSELWRLRGELRLVADSDKSAQALTDVKIALRIAENQGAAVYRLRAAVSAARLFAETGERERAKSILDQVKNLATARSGPDMAAATRLRSDLN